MASIGLLITPISVLVHVDPKANLMATVISCLALFAAGSILVGSRVIALFRERGDAGLGHAGERAVAEELQPLMAQGYRVFHDVPVSRNGEVIENIDHVAVGPHGLVVIETKTRRISTKPYAGKQEVTFDGERLIWPFYANDRSTVRQVQRCAEWAGKLAREECGREIPVQQIIAIPGWPVRPGTSYNPRVVPAGGIAAAIEFITEKKPQVLRENDIKRIVTKFDALCRDAEW